MTKKDFKVIADAIKAAYPRYKLFADENSMSVWYEMLKDLEYAACSDALKMHLQSSVYPPTIADIRRNATAAATPQKWADAWKEVLHSITRFGSYREGEALRSLSPLTRRVVQGIGYRNICMSENPDVVRGQFRSAYEQLASEAEENSRLQKSLVSSIAARNPKAISAVQSLNGTTTAKE